MIKFLCRKTYDTCFCYENKYYCATGVIEGEEGIYYRINLKWFSTNNIKNPYYTPYLYDYFYTVAETRKMKLNNLKNITQ